MPITQNDIVLNGHSIQCRINAENSTNFVPSPGRLWDCHFPSGYGIRVDSHAHIGYDMPRCFDSLLAKIIVWGRTRKEAIRRMRSALNETRLEGVDTLIPLHLRILDEDDFKSRDITIHYIDDHQELMR